MRKTILLITVLFLGTIVNAQNIPVDYEVGGNGDSWTWTVFENDDNPALELIPNPDPTGINTSTTVAKFTARQNGQPFAGCETMHGADIGSWTIDTSNAIIRIMVWKDVISDVGIKLVRVDNWSLGEIKIANTLVNQWEQIEFDFSSHIGNTYDQIVIFPDFNARSSENIIYFDNIYGPFVAQPSAITSAVAAEIKVYPNPSSDILKINVAQNQVDDYQIKIYNSNGIKVFSNRLLQSSNSIDISEFISGLYYYEITSRNQIHSGKFIKE